MNRESIPVARPASFAVGRGVAIRILLAAGAICLAFLPLLEAKDKKAVVDDADITTPQVIGAESSNPILRYPAASFSGWSVFSTSYGWFDVSRTGIRYDVQKPEGKHEESFEATSSEISEIEFKQSYLRFKTQNKRRTVFYVAEDRWGSIHSGPGAMAASARGSMGTASMMQAMKNFDRVLATVKPPPPPGPEVTFTASSLSVERGRTVTLSWTSQGATSVQIEPGVGTVEPAGSRSVTADAATTYVLTAQGPGGSKMASVHVDVTQPTPPTLVLIEPSIAASGQTLEVTRAAFKIRGVAMDNGGMPVVTINGSPANLRPQNPQAAEFWADATLHDGDNVFEVVASNRSQAQTKLVFVAKFAAPAAPPPAAPVVNPKALSKQSILDLLTNFVPSARVAELVRQNGIKFSPTQDDLKEIRSAGGQDDLIDAVLRAPGLNSNP
jgi:hypothetical protein